MVPGSKTSRASRVGGGQQPGTAGKRSGNQLMLVRQQQQAQLAERDAEIQGRGWKQPQHREIPVGKPSEGWARCCSGVPRGWER